MRSRRAAWRKGSVGLTSVAVMAALMISARPAFATTIKVNCNKQDLQPKIEAAAPGATLSIKGTCVGNFTLSENLTLQGAPTATLDGDQSGPTLTILGAPTVHLAHLTITDGLSPNGGGISHAGGPLSLRSVTVEDNAAIGGPTAFGGGIDSAGGSVTLTSSSVVRNRADASRSDSGTAFAFGGGIVSDGPLTVVKSTVSSNQATALSTAPSANGNEGVANGGGIYHGSGAALVVTSSHIDGNRASGSADGTAQGFGGGIFAGSFSATHVKITGSTANENVLTADSPSTDASVGGAGVYFEADTGTVTLSASTFSGNRGWAAGGGGGGTGLGALAVSAKATTLTGVKVIGNRIVVRDSLEALGFGGGVYIGAGPLSITSSSISENAVGASGGLTFAQGGGLYDESGDPVTVSRSTFDGDQLTAYSSGANSQALGGGLILAGPLTMAMSTVSQNTARATTQGSSVAKAAGGGIDLQSTSSAMSLTNSTVTANLAHGDAPLSTGNTTVFGGGIDANVQTLVLTDSTVARNGVGGTSAVAALHGGGLLQESGTVTLRATIVALNTAPSKEAGPNCSGNVGSGGHNLLGRTAGCTFAHQKTDKLNLDPKLGPLANNGGPTLTLALLTGSPAIDAIPKTACLVQVDQRGVKRPQGPACDIGAFELKA